MWEYTEKVYDHFRNPRNVGVIENPDGDGLVGSLACGDALRLMIKVDENEVITDAKFQTFGCASAIASSSALTEMIIGKTIAEAEKITNEDIIKYLGALPKQKVHCSVMGREALKAAIYHYRTGKKLNISLEGNVVCNCFGVTDKEIERAVKGNNLKTVEEVTDALKAGGGCGSCIDDIKKLIAKVRGESEEANESDWTEMTQVQKIRMIEDTIEREIRPMLQQDGGDIELYDLDGNVVLVKLRGACAGCAVSNTTLRDVVESKLREFVSDEISVKAVR